MMSKRLVVLSGIAAIVLGIRFLADQERPESNPKVVAPPPMEHPAVEVTALAERLAMSPPLTPQQIEEDERIDAEQVAHAREWLGSSEPAQRIAGAEQLSAYPTPEAEGFLIRALAEDLDPEVRSAAAQSLTNFEEPTGAAILALLNALEDQDERVQKTALSSLQNVIAEEPIGSVTYTKIAAGLKRKQVSRRVNKETRKFIRDFLSDLGPGNR